MMKQWAALITAIAGLLLAAASFVQAMREPKARAAYEEHAKSIQAAQGAVAENHKDLERLTTFVATQPPPQIITFEAPIATGSPAGGPGGAGGSGGAPSSGRDIRILPIARPPASATATPPAPHPLPPQAPPRAFDSL